MFGHIVGIISAVYFSLHEASHAYDVVEPTVTVDACLCYGWPLKAPAPPHGGWKITLSILSLF